MESDHRKEIAPMAATTEAKVLGLIEIRDKFKGDSRTVQATRMREALNRFPVSTFEARRHLDVMHPAGRVKELREAGLEIETLRLSHPSDIGRPHCIAVYVLKAGGWP